MLLSPSIEVIHIQQPISLWKFTSLSQPLHNIIFYRVPSLCYTSLLFVLSQVYSSQSYDSTLALNPCMFGLSIQLISPSPTYRVFVFLKSAIAHTSALFHEQNYSSIHPIIVFAVYQCLSILKSITHWVDWAPFYRLSIDRWIQDVDWLQPLILLSIHQVGD